MMESFLLWLFEGFWHKKCWSFSVRMMYHIWYNVERPENKSKAKQVWEKNIISFIFWQKYIGKKFSTKTKKSYKKGLRSFSHFQILTKIAYPELSRKLENWLFLEFFFIHCKTMKVSQNDQIQMQTWFTSGFLMNGTELRSFRHFQILTWIAYSDLSRNLENWLILMFAFIPSETAKVSEDDQIRI